MLKYIDFGDDRPLVSIVGSFSEVPVEVDSLVTAINNFPLGVQAWELHPTSPQIRSDESMRTLYEDNAGLSIAHILVVGHGGKPHPELNIPFDIAPVELQYLKYWNDRASDCNVPYLVALWNGTYEGSKMNPDYVALRKKLELHHWCVQFKDSHELCKHTLNMLSALLNSRKYKFDVAISYAGEDRDIARQIAHALDKHGLRIFFDEFLSPDLFGSDLAAGLGAVFENEARYCLMLTSKSYIKSQWATLERQHAQTRQLREPEGYILQVRLDESRIPGIPGTIGYHTYSNVQRLSDLIVSKLTNSRHLTT